MKISLSIHRFSVSPNKNSPTASASANEIINGTINASRKENGIIIVDDDSRRKKVNAVGRSNLKRIKFERSSYDLTLFTTPSDRREICMKAGSCCLKIDDRRTRITLGIRNDR
jgi:hypothetical protein